MDEAIFCQVHIKGHFSKQWSDWFYNLTIDNQPDDEAVLYGWMSDQAAFFGLMEHIRNMGMNVTYVEMLPKRRLAGYDFSRTHHLSADT